MIITVGGIKGGSGKTTIATHFAVLAAEQADVLLVDADDQATAADFTALREEKLGAAGYTCVQLAGAAVRTQTLRMREKYQHIIIDTGGRDTTSQRAALSVSDVFLVPFVPRSFDVWTLERVSQLVSEMRQANPALDACMFLNRADARGTDNSDAVELLRENADLRLLDAPIGSRKAFGNAASQGLAVTELTPSDPKATAEILQLTRYVFDISVKSTGGTH
jgi:chromosome partitioning protein